LARVFNTASSGTVGAAYITPGSIGISVQKNGDLAIDAAKLQRAIDTAPDGVAKLFTNKGKGIADKLVGQVQRLIGPGGSIEKETATINKDIAALSVKKNNLAKALTLQANGPAKPYSQRNLPYGSNNAAGLFSSSQSNGKSSLFNILG
jgi:flagellar hook-associated protein 2